MKEGDQLKFTKDRLYCDLKVRENSLVFVKKIAEDYIEIQGVRFAPKRLAEKTCHLTLNKSLIKKC